MTASYQTSRQVALAAYLEAFDRWVAYPTVVNRQTLEVARSTLELERAIEDAQLRLAI